MQTMKIFFLCSCITVFACAQQKEKDVAPLHWMSLAEAESAMQLENRPILIDLYTNWCSWCRVMDKKTYSNKNVIDYLQKKFYVVRINAETKETLIWQGKQYAYSPENKINTIAIYLSGGNLVFPTTVIIPDKKEEPQAIAGYFEPKDFEVIVKYFGEKKYPDESFDAFQKKLKTAW